MGKSNFSWGDIKDYSMQDPKRSRSKDLFLKLSPGSKYRIRIYGDPIARYCCWHEKKKYIVPEDLIEDFERYTGERVRLYYICNVIDREDTKKGITRFKLLEKGPTVFSAMKIYYEEVGVSPGSENAPDFLIRAVAGKDIRNTKYEVMNIPGETKFSKEELELISRPQTMDEEELKKLPLGERGPIDIEKFYDLKKAKERIQELLDGKIQEKESIEELSESVKTSSIENVKKDSVVESKELDNDDIENESLDELLGQFD